MNIPLLIFLGLTDAAFLVFIMLTMIKDSVIRNYADLKYSIIMQTMHFVSKISDNGTSYINDSYEIEGINNTSLRSKLRDFDKYGLRIFLDISSAKKIYNILNKEDSEIAAIAAWQLCRTRTGVIIKSGYSARVDNILSFLKTRDKEIRIKDLTYLDNLTIEEQVILLAAGDIFEKILEVYEETYHKYLRVKYNIKVKK